MASLSVRERIAAARNKRRTRELDELRTMTPAVVAEALRRSWLLISIGFGTCVALSLALAPAPEGPSFRLLAEIPGWPWSWALLLLIACAMTAVGYARERHKLLVAGLALASAWYACTGAGFGINWLIWVTRDTGTGAAPALYPFFVYALVASSHATNAVAVRTHARRARLLADEQQALC